LPISQIIVAIEIEIEIEIEIAIEIAIEIEIDPCPAWGLALMECSSFAAEFFSTATIR